MENESQRMDIVRPDEQPLLIPTTDIQGRVDQMLANRVYLIEKVKPLLKAGVDVYTIPGVTQKQSLGKPGAEKLAAIFGFSATFQVDKETMEALGALANGKKYIAYVCNLTRGDRQVGQGRGATFIETERTNYRNAKVQEYEAAKALPSFKPEDWQEKTGQYGKFYRVKDGITHDPLALNKAIKMAQKSAFVDAVIRTTGMSDLFTQDLEDAGEAGHTDEPAPPEDKPHQGKQLPKVEDYSTKVDEPKTKPVVNGDGTTDDPFKDEEIKCELCGSVMKRRNGPRGPFLGCSNFPNCKNTKKV